MEFQGRLELANDNAAAFWLAQAEVHGWEHRRGPDFTAVRCERDSTDAHRIVVTRPYEDAGRLAADVVAVVRGWNALRVCVEDPYGRLNLARHGYEAGPGGPVMAREPDAATMPGRPPVNDLTVREALDAGSLAQVERIVVEGFPVTGRQPWVPGRMFPGALLTLSGFRAWLASLDGGPVGGCVTYDDGAVVGVYWVATLPEHRSQGVARAVVERALAAHPGRVATLVATLLGEPLYRRLGFTEQGVSRWWRYQAAAPACRPAPAVERTDGAREASSDR